MSCILFGHQLCMSCFSGRYQISKRPNKGCFCYRVDARCFGLVPFSVDRPAAALRPFTNRRKPRFPLTTSSFFSTYFGSYLQQLIDHTTFSIFGAWVRVSELGKSIVHSFEPAVPFAWWPVAGLGPKPAAFTSPKLRCDIKGCLTETKTKKTS